MSEIHYLYMEWELIFLFDETYTYKRTVIFLTLDNSSVHLNKGVHIKLIIKDKRIPWF